MGGILAAPASGSAWSAWSILSMSGADPAPITATRALSVAISTFQLSATQRHRRRGSQASRASTASVNALVVEEKGRECIVSKFVQAVVAFGLYATAETVRAPGRED